MKARNKKITFTKYQNLANGICKEFRKRGFDCYWAGGAVRDLILGRENPDIDLATGAKPDEIKKVLKQLGYNFYDIGEKFGTIGAITKLGNVEITTFRSESGYVDFRHPSKVRFLKDAKADVMRRDFTINGLLFDPASGEIKDYAGGQEDLKKKLIRFVGAPAKRIKEDPLRMLRAVRFAAQLGFAIAPNDLRKIKKYSPLIKKIAAERIKNELDKIFSARNFLHGIDLLDQTGLLKAILPEVDNLKNVKQSKDFHAEGNAFKHTLLAMSNAADFDLVLRYAVFFHDIGKISTAKKGTRAGREHISFYGHGEKSAEMFQAIAKRLRFTARERKTISYLLKHHMDLIHPEEVILKTLIKWAKKSDFGSLIKLRIADTAGSLMTNKSGKVLKKDLKGLRQIYSRWEKIRAQMQTNLLSGREVMQIANLKQGPRVGLLLQEIKKLQLEGKIKTKSDAKKHLRRLTGNKK